MKQNNHRLEGKGHLTQERKDGLGRCDWSSLLIQQKFWTGSPWRAFGEMLR